MTLRNSQRGLATVEFAIVGATFFLVLFGVLEFGRALFVWNALNEVTRRGARVAVVCPVNHSAIKHVAVFDTPSGAGERPFLHGMTMDHVHVEVLDAGPAVIGDPQANFTDIRYVRVSITGYQ